MTILLLGGTAFLGRAIAAEAAVRGHDLTCLARGNRGPSPHGRMIRADRDDQDGLRGVSSTTWDVVIDLATHPEHVQRQVRDLQARHRIFVSTMSVCDLTGRFEPDESAPTVAPLEGARMQSQADYGAAKAACEKLLQEADSECTIIRPGLLGGAGDQTGRSGYYPWRFAHPTGEDVIMPDLTWSVSVLDVEDLAAWILVCAQSRIRGTFHAGGMTTTLADVASASRKVAGSSTAARAVPADELLRQGISPWAGPTSLPLWTGEEHFRHAATVDSSSARALGLRNRPLEQTLASALSYEEHRSAPRRCGLADEEERDLRRRLDAR